MISAGAVFDASQASTRAAASALSPAAPPGVARTSLGCGDRNTTGIDVRVNQDCSYRLQGEEIVKFNPANPTNLIAGMNDERQGFNLNAFERAPRLLDRIKRDKDIPEPLIAVHEPDGGDPGLRTSPAEPLPDVRRVELIFRCELDELPHDLFEELGTSGSSSHRPPAALVLVREALESEPLMPQVCRRPRVTGRILFLREREAIPGQISEAELGATELQGLDAVAERSQERQRSSDGDQRRAPGAVARDENGRHARREHADSHDPKPEAKEWGIAAPAA